MKARIQSVEQLKKAAAAQLEAEFQNRLSTALLEGAVQGMAFVMYALETGEGWKAARQQRLFGHMLSLTNLIESVPWLQPFQAKDIKEHIEKEFGVDFKRILEVVEAQTPTE